MKKSGESVSIHKDDVGRKVGADRDRGVSRRELLAFTAGAAANALLPKGMADGQAPTEAVLSPEETIATIERVTGMPYAEFSKHFEGLVKIPSPRGGTYVIHIRQMHQHARDPKNQVLDQAQVVARQRETEKLIASVVRANTLDGIFAEGYVDTITPQRYRDAVRQLQAQVSELGQRGIRTMGDAEKVFAEFGRAYDTSMRRRILYHYTMRDIRTLAHTLRNTFSALVPQSATERMRLAELDSKLGAYGAERTDMEVPDPYTEGAELKLFMDGKLKHIYSTEERAANERAIEATLAYKEARKDYAEGRISNRARERLLRAYWETYAPRHRILFEKVGERDRERARAGKPPENVVILFGGEPRHDFTDMVRGQNQTRGRAGRGLIELWPKEGPSRGPTLE